VPREKPWRWRPAFYPVSYADGLWRLCVFPYWWWQRPGWDFNEFGVELGVGSWSRRLAIRDND